MRGMRRSRKSDCPRSGVAFPDTQLSDEKGMRLHACVLMEMVSARTPLHMHARVPLWLLKTEFDMQRQDTTNLTKKLGKRIYLLRSRRNESQQAFAELVGISRGYLSDVERGVREMSLATLASICQRTGQSSNKLLGL